MTWTLGLITLASCLGAVVLAGWMALWMGVTPWAVALLALGALAGLAMLVHRVWQSAPGADSARAGAQASGHSGG